MREIKFRAWGDKTSTIYSWQIMQDSFKDCGLTDTTNFLTVMQWTGLLDKNGVEIYEGDIVRYTGDGCPTTTEAVEWNDELAGFAPFCKQIFDAPDSYSEWEITDCEVIGNIYENSELLKD